MPLFATLTGALDRELAWARLALEAIVAVLRLPDVEATAGVRTHARARFSRFSVAAAVVGPDGIEMANEAWLSHVGPTVPGWVQACRSVVSRSGTMVHLDGIHSEVDEAPLAATIARAHAGDMEAVLVICVALSEAAIAAQLLAPTDALVWSGAVASGKVPDYRNRRARAIARGDELVRWQNVFAEGHDARWARSLADAIQQRASVKLEIELRLADGLTVRHRAAILVTPNATRWFTVAIPASPTQLVREERDRLLTQIQATQRDAEAARRVHDHVLATVSHELRAPITTIMLWLRVLRDPHADPAARLQAIDAIEQSAAAQTRIVGDLLDVSRAISGKLHVDLRTVDIAALLRGALESSLPAAQAKGVKLTHDADALLGEIQGDAARLRQVFDNLLGNAIKFTPAGGEVRVRTRRKRLAVVIEVEDTGCGIEPDALNLIFEPFRQLEHGITASDGGLGLGLAIALQLVELHHGSIEAMSEGRDRGAKFTVTLPAPGHRRAPSPPSGVVAARALAGIRVLVIDDDARVRDALTGLLTRVGANVIPAESVAVARERLTQQPPHAVICDIAMPGEDGNAFLRWLRASGNHVPAIALTGYASNADAVTALSSGFDLHCAKPIDFEVLVARLTHLLASKIT